MMWSEGAETERKKKYSYGEKSFTGNPNMALTELLAAVFGL